MAEACLVTLTLLAALAGLIYLFLVWNFGYWRKRGVQEAKSYPICGSFPSAFTHKRNMAYDLNEIYTKYKHSENYVGVFMCRAPQLFILDAELVHKIYVNDFKHFHDNEFSQFVDDKADIILANNPFAIAGDKWKERRFEIIPGLTANRIQNAYPVTLEVCKRLRDYINHQLKMPTKDGIDMNELCLRFTSEVVTNCVLGIEAASLTDNPTPILGMIKKLFDQTFMFIIYQLIVGLIPALKSVYKVRIFPKVVQKFFFNLLQQSIDLRRTQQVERIDFLNYLLQLQEKKQLSTVEITSHVMTFMTDGFITTAFVMMHCLGLLARNPEKQRKLRQEIMQSLEADGNISFECISEMPYLDACVHEALRIFPPVLFISKICTIPYEMTNKNGKVLQVNKNDVVMISTFSLHHDERFYEKPAEFQPERFMPENGGMKKYRDEGKFLGFGNGPRICLGMRFALVQAKAGIAEIIKSFNVAPNPRMRNDNFLDRSQFFGVLDGGVWLDLTPIT